tara:strand:- start:338 stop:565 length:228 start_codon:yes stop_codon:yes gene_type:complete
MYFVIKNTDGDTIVSSMTKEVLEERLNEDWYGTDVKFLNEIPKNNDTNYWGEDILIIKGDIVTPKPVQTVTEYEI